MDTIEVTMPCAALDASTVEPRSDEPNAVPQCVGTKSRRLSVAHRPT